MSIQDITEKFKALIEDDTVFFGLLLVLVGCVSFGLGKLSVPIETSAQPAGIVLRASAVPMRDAEDSAAARAYVASRNSDKYHLVSCPGAARIKEENKIWFKTKEEAEAAGYTPAGNCEGI